MSMSEKINALPQRRAESDTSTIHAGMNSAVLDPHPIAHSLRGHETGDYPGGPLDAALGIGNALMFGSIFWILAYFLLRLV